MNITLELKGDGWHYYCEIDAVDNWTGGPFTTSRAALLDVDKYLPEQTAPPPLGVHVSDGVGSGDKVGG